MNDGQLLRLYRNGQPSEAFSGSLLEIEAIERAVGGPLPQAYLSLMSRHDGGHPEAGCFRVPGDNDENLVDIDRFYSLSNPLVEGIASALKAYGPVLGPGALPFGRDGGGNQFFLKVSCETPSVWICFLDEGNVSVKLADSFEDFIAGLTTNPDFI